MTRPLSICLVTEELAIDEQTGGIGSAFRELAELLARHHRVTILFLPRVRLTPAQQSEIAEHFARGNIQIQFPEPWRYSHDPGNPVAASYCIFRHLLDSKQTFDILHFHDYKGLAYHCLLARDQGLAFARSVFAVGVHGPSRWTLELNDALFTEAAQLKVDHMERACIARSDYLISPSRYMFSWLAEKGWVVPPPDRCLVLHNACSEFFDTPVSAESNQPINEIIFFGRHETRKGMQVFCEALNLIADDLSERGTLVTFLGGFGMIGAEHSGIVLAQAGKRWNFPVRLLPYENRAAAVGYLGAAENGLVVVPSPVENSPYAVLEAIGIGRPVLTSRAGGAKELLDSSLYQDMTLEITAPSLAQAMLRAVTDGMPRPRLSERVEHADHLWLEFHGRDLTPRVARAGDQQLPRVTVCITHYQRPEKLVDAIASVARQSYPNIELIVVDDGSPDPVVQAGLDSLEPEIERLGGRLLRRENGYLGAARNTGAAAATGEYLCFLDDDDIALPNMITRYVTAALNTGADIVTGMQVNLDENRRFQAWPDPDDFPDLVDYLPLGDGPLSLAVEENVFGPATALIAREAFERLGGYTTLKGVGHEDLELFLRASQQKMRIELCPFPAYLYEVGRPSMISSTPLMRNYARVTNAIDAAAQPEDWHDFLRLASGRKALSVIAERKVRAAGSGETESEVPTKPPMVVLQWLMDYANSIGSPALASAFSDAKHFYLRLSELDAVPKLEERLRVLTQIDGRTVIAAEPGRLNPEMPVLVDALRGRLDSAATAEVADVPAAIGRLRKALENAKAPIQTLLFELSALSRTELNQLEASSIIETLLRVDRPMRERMFIHVQLFSISMQVGLWRQAHDIIMNLLQQEEPDYLERYPDVAKAVEEGHLPSGLMHFLRHGESEGRQGFKSALEAVRRPTRTGNPQRSLSQTLSWLESMIS